ncbi:UNVERIFIED_CONTAM: Alpha carbonic anhydrase 7 [Sesamum radiatum]|uniref:Carbonic anhydrase n=1 Tax=Sesamum radiatum TaxID=300843 RepID=A0AAW2ULY4_SESRA
MFNESSRVDDERGFSYKEDSKIGPTHWGEIRPEWKDCSSGEMQSPIDLLNERVEVVSHLGKLKRSYKPSNTTLINRGHDMMLRWPGGAGHIQINGTLYQLKQCHWHSPSEHTINGMRFDMEVHLVHQSDDNHTAVIGIMYKIGRPDSFLSMVRTVTREQVQLIRNAVHDDSETNARPIQPVHKRVVELYRPRDGN